MKMEDQALPAHTLIGALDVVEGFIEAILKQGTQMRCGVSAFCGDLKPRGSIRLGSRT